MPKIQKPPYNRLKPPAALFLSAAGTGTNINAGNAIRAATLLQAVQCNNSPTLDAKPIASVVIVTDSTATATARLGGYVTGLRSVNKHG